MSSTGTARVRLAPPATVLLPGCLALILALVAAESPLASLAHQSVNASTAGSPWWALVPFGVVGFVMVERAPGRGRGHAGGELAAGAGRPGGQLPAFVR